MREREYGEPTIVKEQTESEEWNELVEDVHAAVEAWWDSSDNAQTLVAHSKAA